MAKQEEKKPVGRPPAVIPPIPYTVENVVKAVMRPRPPKPQEDKDS